MPGLEFLGGFVTHSRNVLYKCLFSARIFQIFNGLVHSKPSSRQA